MASHHLHPHALPHEPVRVRPLISRLAPIGRLSAKGMGNGTVLAMTWLTSWLACVQDKGGQQQQQQENNNRGRPHFKTLPGSVFPVVALQPSTMP